MRQIKFRAWDKKAKVMVYPVVVYETQDHVGFSEETFNRCYGQDKYYGHLQMGDYWYYLFDDKVMQYTGLQDANGQKIFEGDLLAVCFGINDNLVGIVEQNEYGTWMVRGSGVCKVYDIIFQSIVIGNIYQNKELLNEVKK